MFAIVDDDPVYKKITEIRLRQKHKATDILMFADGEEAYRFLCDHDQSEELPDVILLDINMPIMNGWDFLDHFRALKPFIRKSIRIYIVSSSASQSDQSRARLYQEVSDYLIKPLNENDMGRLFKEA